MGFGLQGPRQYWAALSSNVYAPAVQIQRFLADLLHTTKYMKVSIFGLRTCVHSYRYVDRRM